MEQRGIQTDRGNINRSIQAANLKIEEINREIEQLKHEVEQERERLTSEELILAELYGKTETQVLEAVEELANHLTEEGQDSIIQQQSDIEIAGQLQKPPQKQESSVPVVEPEQPSGVAAAQAGKQEEKAEHISSGRGRRDFNIEQAYEEKTPEQAQQQTPEPEPSGHHVRGSPAPGSPPPEPELLRQRKSALERKTGQPEKEAGSRSPPHAHPSMHSGGRTLAQQRRNALKRQKQERQKAEGLKTRQEAQHLPRHHSKEDLSEQRKIAMEGKNKGPVSEAYKEGHHERGNDVQRKPHHDAERGRQYIKRHDKKLQP